MPSRSAEPTAEPADVNAERDRPIARRSALQDLVQQNALALVSLLVALFGLGYNTWRNETTEHHRNVRQSAFVALDALGEAQQLADTRFFGADHSEANRIAIWGRITLIRDVATLVSADTGARATDLFAVWSARAPAFDEGDPAAEKAVSNAIGATRAQVLSDLRRLK